MDDLISRQAAITSLTFAEETGRMSCGELKGVIEVLNRLPSAQPDVADINAGDTIYRQAVFDVLREECSTAVEDFLRDKVKAIPPAQPEQRWSGLWSEPQDDKSIYGEKLIEGDTIYLLGVEGSVRYECGSWGWGSSEYVPWEELEEKIPHSNSPTFCYCDNFISFWELKWNFDDGYDWDGVPYISHKPDMRGEQDE